jgi:PhnB protein
MANSPVQAIPEGMHTLTPHLICADASTAIDFYKRAFGAVELNRTPGPDGRLMNAMLRIGDSAIMLMDENLAWGALSPTQLKGTPVSIHLYVNDVDAAFAKAVKEGATSKMPPADMFWGDRFSSVLDPSGHSWSIASHVKDVTPDEVHAAALKMGACEDDGPQ